MAHRDLSVEGNTYPTIPELQYEIECLQQQVESMREVVEAADNFKIAIGFRKFYGNYKPTWLECNLFEALQRLNDIENEQ